MLSFSDYLTLTKQGLYTNHIRKTKQGAVGEIIKAIFENRRYLSQQEQGVLDKITKQLQELIH